MIDANNKFQSFRSSLNSKLLERSDEIDIVLTALLANEHCCLVGDPGTGKSLLADAVSDWIDGNVFKVLMNKTTKREEIVGPVSISSLKSDEYKHITKGMLPEADVAFLDEIFKASSAVLNLMLKILNERQFTNGSSHIDCPLKLCVAASNEWPTDAKELGALFDRFLFRKTVNPVSSEASVMRLMFDDSLSPEVGGKISMLELESSRQDIIHNVKWSEESKQTAIEIRRKLQQEGIVIGDRRLRKSIFATKCYAWLNGNSEVTNDDLEILSHIWWNNPETQPSVVSDVIADIAMPSRLIVTQLLTDAMDIMSQVDMKAFETHGSATHKLSAIHKKLKSISGQRSEDAQKSVSEMVKNIRLATIAMIED